MRIAILDDYQDAARNFADWGRLPDDAELTVFTDHVADPDALAAPLEPFEVLCVMRERMPLPAAMLERLPRLKLIVTSGPSTRRSTSPPRRRGASPCAARRASATPPPS